MDYRKRTEKKYKKLLGEKHDKSFLYSIVVGSHAMGKPEDYPGYSYYFKLLPEQIDKAIFHIVRGKGRSTKPMRGQAGLDKALSTCLDESKNYKSVHEKGIHIKPRVEVVLPFSVKPEMYVPQIEDR